MPKQNSFSRSSFADATAHTFFGCSSKAIACEMLRNSKRKENSFHKRCLKITVDITNIYLMFRYKLIG